MEYHYKPRKEELDYNEMQEIANKVTDWRRTGPNSYEGSVGNIRGVIAGGISFYHNNNFIGDLDGDSLLFEKAVKVHFRNNLERIVESVKLVRSSLECEKKRKEELRKDLQEERKRRNGKRKAREQFNEQNKDLIARANKIMKQYSFDSLLSSGSDKDKETIALFCEKAGKYREAYQVYRSTNDIESMKRLQNQHGTACGVYADLEVEALGATRGYLKRESGKIK